MMKSRFLDIPPLTSAAGTVRLPGSKSISNRLLLLAGLSSGQTELIDVLDSDDTQVMLEALQALGADVRRSGSTTVVAGLDGRLAVREAQLFLGNAGTAMRPVTAALAILAARDGGTFELAGTARMHERPIGDLVDALRLLGCRVDYLGIDGYPPLRVSGPAALEIGRPIRVRGDVSSQFLTALLLALPLAAAEQDAVVEVVGELISRPYVEMTLKLLERFGVAVRRAGDSRFVLPAGAAFRSPGRLHVEGDASAASYFVALGAIASRAEPVRIDGAGADSIQGDIAFVDAARAMGADVRTGPGWIEARRGKFPLDALSIDCKQIPDAAMTLAVLALYANGTTRLDGIASWKVKETDRIAAMAAELAKLGAGIRSGDDFIEIDPPTRWRPAAIATYDDHRMAMCFSLAAFNALGRSSGLPVRIIDPGCVSKTYPGYFDDFFALVDAERAAVPVVAIDGPTASGKGTLAAAVAQQLGYRTLESGALYRATALAALRAGIAPDAVEDLAALAGGLDLRFAGGRTFLGGEDVTDALRREDVGALASAVSAFAPVRDALLRLQLSFRRAPGLVADGRDMGTVVFPDARLKIFLTASAATRAERRYKQLISKGIQANIDDLRAALAARDARDVSRSVAPLKAAEDAVLLDNSALSVEASVEAVLEAWQERSPFG